MKASIHIPSFLREAPYALPWESGASDGLVDLERELVSLSSAPWERKAHLTLADCLRGIQIFGSTGSGKTSGSGAHFAKAFLRAGYGGVVLCVKADEAKTWKHYARSTGREADLRIITADGGLTYNFLEEEWLRSKRSALNVTQTLIDVQNLYARYGQGTASGNQDSFWNTQLQTLLTHAVVLSKAIYGELSGSTLLSVIRGALAHASQEGGTLGHKTPFETQLEAVYGPISSGESERMSRDYFIGEFRNMAYKTRSIIIAMATSICEPLEQHPLKALFSGKSTVRPEDAFDGRVLVIDLSVHEHRKAGLLCQLLWKMAFRSAVKQRASNPALPLRPTFLWADESQHFLEDADLEFLTTARSLKCLNVYLTQSVTNYYAVLGSEARANAILGSMNVRIFHQNSDPKTNEWASRTIGQEEREKVSVSERALWSWVSDHSKTLSKHKQWEAAVRPSAFTTLKDGGVRNRHKVEAIAHIAGREFGGKSWFKAVFRQG